MEIKIVDFMKSPVCCHDAWQIPKLSRKYRDCKEFHNTCSCYVNGGDSNNTCIFAIKKKVYASNDKSTQRRLVILDDLVRPIKGPNFELFNQIFYECRLKDKSKHINNIWRPK